MAKAEEEEELPHRRALRARTLPAHPLREQPETVEFWPAWDRELAKQGRSTSLRPTPEAAKRGEPSAQERDFLSKIRVRQFVKYHDNQVLNYDTEGIAGPGVFRAIFTHASVFGNWRVLRDVAIILLVCIISVVTLFLAKTEITEANAVKLKSLVTDFHTLCTFLLTFFLATALTRWWAIRNDCLGGLWGGIDDISLIIGSYFGSDSPADRAVRERVLRWSVLSHELIYKQARADTDLCDLVERDLLTIEELNLLKPLASKPQVIWAWMCSYFAHLAYGDPAEGGSRLPFPVTVLPQLHEICRHARGAVGASFAYTDTQIPFRYVHFLSLIIWTHNLIQAVNSSVVFVVEADKGERVNIAIEASFLVLYPLVYFGLLNLGAGMLNPLRSSQDVDFPRGAFSYYMLAENRSFYAGNVQPGGPPYGAPPVWTADKVRTRLP